MSVPNEASIPKGAMGDAIQRGKGLLTDTHKQLPRNVGNGLNCTSCHLNGGTTAYASPWVGLAGAFPEYRSRSGGIISLRERVNGCFQRSMNGKPLAFDSAEMSDIMAYEFVERCAISGRRCQPGLTMAFRAAPNDPGAGWQALRVRP